MGSPARREMAEQIVWALPLAVVRLPHTTALRHCTAVANPWPGVRLEAARWGGRTVDLEVMRTATGSHELTVFGFEHGRRIVLLYRAGLELAELALALTADLPRAATKKAAHV
jgi:hypothetical protein